MTKKRNEKMSIKCVKKLFGVMFFIVTLSIPSISQAVLINLNWQTANDGLIVRDTTTSIEWLNVSESYGLTYDYVSGEFGVGGAFEGMRYATNDEVINLFATYFNLDLSANQFPEWPGYIDPAVRLASETIGDGISSGWDNYSGPDAGYIVSGYTADLRLDGERFWLGAQTTYSDSWYFTAEDPRDPFALTNPLSRTGSFLVRPVPVPAAAWLFGSGLIGLVGFARRKKA